MSFLDMIPKAQTTRRNPSTNWDCIQLESFCTSKETIKWKGNLWSGRKYLQTVYWISGYYLQFTKNSYNLITENKTVQLKNGHRSQPTLLGRHPSRVTPALPHLTSSHGWDCSWPKLTPGKGWLEISHSSMSILGLAGWTQSKPFPSLYWQLWHRG